VMDEHIEGFLPSPHPETLLRLVTSLVREMLHDYYM